MKTKTLGALVLPVALGFAALPAAALSVTAANVSVTPARSAGPCPVEFKFTGKVSLNGKGSFTYKWERSDGGIDNLVHPAVPSDGIHPALVTETWTLGAAMPAFHPFHGWVKLHILTPEDRISDPAEFTLDCGGGSTAGGPPNTACNGKPDLVPVLHTPMDGFVAVKNIGAGNANASRVIIRCHKEGHTGPGGGCVDVPASLITPPFFAAADGLGMNVPALACGAEFTATMSWWAKVNWPKGKYDFTATADFTFLVAESNEANNSTTSTLVK